MSEDPIGFEAGDANLYRYVTNRPTISVDHRGAIAARVPSEQSRTLEPPSRLPGHLLDEYYLLVELAIEWDQAGFNFAAELLRMFLGREHARTYDLSQFSNVIQSDERYTEKIDERNARRLVSKFGGHGGAVANPFGVEFFLTDPPVEWDELPPIDMLKGTDLGWALGTGRFKEQAYTLKRESAGKSTHDGWLVDSLKCQYSYRYTADMKQYDTYTFSGSWEHWARAIGAFILGSRHYLAAKKLQDSSLFDVVKHKEEWEEERTYRVITEFRCLALNLASRHFVIVENQDGEVIMRDSWR